MQSQYIFGQVHTLLFFEFVNQVANDALVKVFTTEERIAIGCQHFKLFFTVHIGDFDNRHVKRTTTQVVHRDFAIAAFFFVQAKRQCRRGWLIDDAFHVQTRDASRVFGCLTLRIIEIRRHSNHRFGHRFAQIIFSGFFHFAQDFSRNLRRS